MNSLSRPTVSIIIACKSIGILEKQCVEACRNLNYSTFEIIILPDNKSDHSLGDRVKTVPTGNVRPDVKRNIGLKHSKHDIIAFIDSDAYPESSWLKNATPYFSDA